MKYEIYEPSDSLSALVKCYWTLDADAENPPQRQTIVPDGCMEMIFHHGDLYRQFTQDGNSIIQPRSFVFGQLSQPLQIEPTGKTGIFAARFHPDGFLPFATIAIKELENKAVDLETLYGTDGTELAAKMTEANAVTDKIAVLERFFLDRLSNQKIVDAVVKSTIDLILESNGGVSVNTLSQESNTNRRLLERRFASNIGMSPKQLSKTIRMQNAIKLLLSGKYESFTALAYESEYYDQAHFIKDFREFTGLTPKEFYGDNVKMSALFYSPE